MTAYTKNRNTMLKFRKTHRLCSTVIFIVCCLCHKTSSNIRQTHSTPGTVPDFQEQPTHLVSFSRLIFTYLQKLAQSWHVLQLEVNRHVTTSIPNNNNYRLMYSKCRSRPCKTRTRLEVCSTTGTTGSPRLLITSLLEDRGRKSMRNVALLIQSYAVFRVPKQDIM
jgi:hypothetical protein